MNTLFTTQMLVLCQGELNRLKAEPVFELL